MENFKRKISSRKFWALLAALAVAILTAWGADPGTSERVVGVISAIGACACYMLAEAHADVARTKSSTNENNR